MANIAHSFTQCKLRGTRWKIIEVIEVEDLLTKNAGYGQYLTCYTRPYLIKHILEYINDEFGISEFDNCYYEYRYI